MPQHRKPTNVQQLTGTFKHNPDRLLARANEPQAEGEIGPAPKYFDKLQRACYVEFVRKCHAGVLCAADGTVIEVAAVLLAKLRRDTDSFLPADFARLHMILAALGMTPADRSRVSVRKKEGEATPMDEFKRA